MSFLGKSAYKYIYKPILSPINSNDGLVGHLKVLSGKKQMQKAAKNLIIPDFKKIQTNITVVGVAGKGNWYQMIFCLYSLYKNLGFNLQTVIIDDGTIDKAVEIEIKKQVPFVTIIPHHEADYKAKQFFNKDQYPAIASVLDKFVVFKKLFHVRALINGPALVLDADMLFYKTPEELIQWINKPDKPVYMYDKHSIYGDQREDLLNKLPIKPNVNTGIIGLNNDDFDFNQLEKLTAQYLNVDSLNYLMEQALYAMCLTNRDAICLDPKDYEILPSKAEAKKPTGVMHHFPTENRQFYYRYAWRNVIN